jgi:hypothetical protein
METKTELIDGAKKDFKAGYAMLPVKFQNKLKSNIMNRCGWNSIMTFHNKRKGEHRIKPLEVVVIEQEFSKYGINPWTGTKII